MLNAFYKNCRPINPFNLSLYTDTLTILHAFYDKILKPKYDLLPYDEAILPRYLDPNKSPGYPWGHLGCSSHKDVFMKYPNQLRAIVQLILDGHDVDMVFTDFLKDELRPIDRVKSKSTRVINGMPMHWKIVAIMLYSNLSEDMRLSVGAHPCTIGVELPGPSYVKLMTEVSNRDNSHSGDQSHFDITYEHDSACAARDFFGSKVHKRLNQEYFSKVFAGYHLVFGRIIQLVRQCSGQLLTGETNSFRTLGAFFHAWHVLTGLYVNEFMSLVTLWCNGDDWVYGYDESVMTNVKLRFDPQVVGDFLVGCNMYLTSANVQSVDVWSLEYLGHSLRKRYVPFMDKTIVVTAGRFSRALSSLNFKKGSNPLLYCQRLIGLLQKLWPFYEQYSYLYNIVVDQVVSVWKQHGALSTDEWRVLLASIPTDIAMVRVHTHFFTA